MSIFAHIVEAGSLTGAAEVLELSKSVVSQHLKSLEKELGIILLKRTTRRQMLTVTGQKFYERCKELNQVADTAWLTAQEDLTTPTGRVRITAPNALMETLVTPATASLLRQYPELELEFISSDQHLDLYAENIDLAIRVGESAESALKQRCIGGFRDVLCGQASYLADKNLDELSYVANSWQGRQVTHELKGKNEADILFQCEAQSVANSFHTCLSLINLGVAVGLIPDFYFKNEAESLKEVFPNHQLSINSVYALHPFGKNLPLSVSICLQAIEEGLEKNTDK